MNIWEDTTRGNSYAPKQLIELFIILHCKSDMARNYATFLVIAGSIARKLKDLCTEVFEYSSEVNGSSGPHAGGIFALTEITADTTDRELKTGFGQ